MLEQPCSLRRFVLHVIIWIPSNAATPRFKGVRHHLLRELRLLLRHLLLLWLLLPAENLGQGEQPCGLLRCLALRPHVGLLPAHLGRGPNLRSAVGARGLVACLRI